MTAVTDGRPMTESLGNFYGLVIVEYWRRVGTNGNNYIKNR
jgi:hypothetical protein